MRRTGFAIGLAGLLMACGGGSGSSPTGSSPTTTAVTVDLPDLMRMGKTVSARGTATLANGQTQAVTSGWRSDAATVATTTDAGAVTGVGNGEASIYVVVGGVQGARRIRVVPDYDGRWNGSQVYTGCSASGQWSGICEDPDFASLLGLSYPLTLTIRHGDSLTLAGEFTLDGVAYPGFEAQVAGDGSLAISGTLTLDQLRSVVEWSVGSPQNSRLSGTIREAYSAPDLLSGEIVLSSDLAGVARAAATARAASPVANSARGLIRRYAARRGR